METNKVSLAHAFGLTTAILWVLCVIVVALFPVFSLTVTQSWMHGMDMTSMGGWYLSFNGIFFGGVAIVICAWITGFIFGWSLEFVSKKK